MFRRHTRRERWIGFWASLLAAIVIVSLIAVVAVSSPKRYSIEETNKIFQENNTK